jgi:hypothetical protein
MMMAALFVRLATIPARPALGPVQPPVSLATLPLSELWQQTPAPALLATTITGLLFVCLAITPAPLLLALPMVMSTVFPAMLRSSGSNSQISPAGA